MIQLNNGILLPQIGFGTYKAEDDDGLEAIQMALETGYRLFDTAAYYFNEETVGKAIRTSKIPREEILVATKVWREHLGYKETHKAFVDSIEKLGLDYIDLYLIHWPANQKNYADWQKTNAETWRAMEELYEDGKIKAIGVCNFTQKYLQPLIDSAKIQPMINQIEFHPGYWQPDVYDFCKENNIVMQAWSPLARGRVFDNDFLQQLSKKYHNSVAQICLRWIIEKGVIPIPKSSAKNRIEDNFDVFDFELLPDEIQAIDNLPETGFSGELPDIWPDRLKKD